MRPPPWILTAPIYGTGGVLWLRSEWHHEFLNDEPPWVAEHTFLAVIIDSPGEKVSAVAMEEWIALIVKSMTTTRGDYEG